jgi:hypothetical protein
MNLVRAVQGKSLKNATTVCPKYHSEIFLENTIIDFIKNFGKNTIACTLRLHQIAEVK